MPGERMVAASVGGLENLQVLSPRQRQVLTLLSEGRSNRELADALGLSVHAVKFHLASIFRKLGVSNRTEAAAAYLRHYGEPMH